MQIELYEGDGRFQGRGEKMSNLNPLFTPPNQWAKFFPHMRGMIRQEQWGRHWVNGGPGFSLERYSIIKPYQLGGFYHQSITLHIVFAHGHGEVTLANLTPDGRMLGIPKMFEVNDQTNCAITLPPFTACKLYMGVGTIVVCMAPATPEEVLADMRPFDFPDEAAAA